MTERRSQDGGEAAVLGGESAALVLPVVPRVGLLLDALPEAVVTTDTAHRITGWNEAAERLFGLSRSTMIGASVLEVLAHELRPGADADVKAALDRGETWTGGAVARGATGATLELRFTAAAIGAGDAFEGYVIVAHDITAQVRAERSAETAEARFADFMEAAPAIAYIKDHEGRYVFVNELALRMKGDPVRPAWQGKTDYDLWPPAIAAQIRENDGLTLAGTVPLESIQIVALDDGPHTLLIRKFPLRSASGKPLLGGIGLDITDRVRAEAKIALGQEREAHASLLARERAVVADALGRLRTGGTVATIATSIARLVLGLPGLEFASVLLFETDGRATPVGLAHAAEPVAERRSVPPARSRALRLRAQDGPWVEPWKPSTGDPLSGVIKALDIGVLGYAPISSGDDVFGILAVGAAGPTGAVSVTERLPAIVEFAGLAGALLGSGVAAHVEIRRGRSEILSIIEKGAFEPVFQPIVQLPGRTPVGYEALTRFHDGVPPALRFAEAASIGLGPELELATLDAALRAAHGLPHGLGLHINVSPALVLAGDTLRTILGSQDRPIVYEVTEHAIIEDYDAFRDAVSGLGAFRMAVDDAGAGFASLRHILELRPAFVKLDRSLMAAIDGDPVRQALIVGMCHFASSAGCDLIAEGIETEAEMAALLKLGIPLGQGFLLGRPTAAPAG
jgi:PAS domain S-box-containing protein